MRHLTLLEKESEENKAARLLKDRTAYEEMTKEDKDRRQLGDRIQHQVAFEQMTEEDKARQRLQNAMQHKVAYKEMTEEDKVERQEKDKNQKRNLKSTSIARLRKFRVRVRWGPSFPCISCHQTLFLSQVIRFDKSLETRLQLEWNNGLFIRALAEIPISFHLSLKEDEVYEKKQLGQTVLLQS